MAGHEFLDRVLGRTPMIVSVRKYYSNVIRKEIEGGTLEKDLPFASRNMYQNWVNYSPHFFFEFKSVYDSLIEKGYEPRELAPLVENKFRILRYFTQILLPGAYLDQTTSKKEKFEFLNNFSRTMESVLQHKGYEGNFASLSTFAMSGKRKTAVGRMVQVLSQASELVYFGEQPMGLTEYGLDSSSLHDYYIAYRNFDLNLGQRKYEGVGKVQTIVAYDRHSVPPYIIHLVDEYANLFYHREWNKVNEWVGGTPHMDSIAHGSILMDGKELLTDDINQLIGRVAKSSREIGLMRRSMSDEDLNYEYCLYQSLAIKNMNRALGIKWRLPQSAVASLKGDIIMRDLQKSWNLKHNVEVAFELIKRSIEWAKQGLG